MKKKTDDVSDIDVCKDRIQSILREFNCSIIASDDYCWPLLLDLDTEETTDI